MPYLGDNTAPRDNIRGHSLAGLLLMLYERLQQRVQMLIDLVIVLFERLESIRQIGSGLCLARLSRVVDEGRVIILERYLRDGIQLTIRIIRKVCELSRATNRRAGAGEAVQWVNVKGGHYAQCPSSTLESRVASVIPG